jgi:quinol monooxygenase YgiN
MRRAFPRPRPVSAPTLSWSIEKWETLAHLQAHAVAPHMKAHGEKTKELVEGKLIHVLEPV